MKRSYFQGNRDRIRQLGSFFFFYEKLVCFGHSHLSSKFIPRSSSISRELASSKTRQQQRFIGPEVPAAWFPTSYYFISSKLFFSSPWSWAHHLSSTILLWLLNLFSVFSNLVLLVNEDIPNNAILTQVLKSTEVNRSSDSQQTQEKVVTLLRGWTVTDIYWYIRRCTSISLW